MLYKFSYQFLGKDDMPEFKAVVFISLFKGFLAIIVIMFLDLINFKGQIWFNSTKPIELGVLAVFFMGFNGLYFLRNKNYISIIDRIEENEPKRFKKIILGIFIVQFLVFSILVILNGPHSPI